MLAFLRDIDQLVQNVKGSAQTDSLKARQFVNEACHLQDQALSMMSQVNRDLVKQCDRMAAEQGGTGNNGGKKRRRVSFVENDVAENEVEPMESVTPSSTVSPPNHKKSSLRNGRRRSDKAEKEDEEEVLLEAMSIVVEHMEVENPLDEDGDREEDEDGDDGMSVTVNWDTMKTLVERLVEVTKGYNVQEMEEKMYNLLRIVYQHSNKWDKSELVEELNEHISSYFKAKMDA